MRWVGPASSGGVSARTVARVWFHATNEPTGMPGTISLMRVRHAPRVMALPCGCSPPRRSCRDRFVALHGAVRELRAGICKWRRRGRPALVRVAASAAPIAGAAAAGPWAGPGRPSAAHRPPLGRPGGGDSGPPGSGSGSRGGRGCSGVWRRPPTPSTGASGRSAPPQRCNCVVEVRCWDAAAPLAAAPWPAHSWRYPRWLSGTEKGRACGDEALRT